MTNFLLFLLMFSSQTVEARNHTDLLKVQLRDTATLLQQNYLSLPMFVDSDLPLVDKEYFSPARGSGQEPLPSPVRELLLPVRPDRTPPRVAAVTVRTSCQRNQMQLQVERKVLGGGEPVSHLKLGSCHVSRSTNEHLYFEYDLRMCGTKRSMIDNRMVYVNTLRYEPPEPKGAIRRTAPFSLPIACYFNRYVYSYKIGYTPKMQMRKVFKKMKNAAKFVLKPRNAQWTRLSDSHHYLLGEPMFFEAEAESLLDDERLYVHACYVTPEKSHLSSPQFPVIQNFGCLVESKNSPSRFFPHKNDAVRFSVDAFLFKGMTGQQLYMHCTMSVGGSVPTPTAKSCSYDAKSRRWVEVFGPNSVCDCCDSDCKSEKSAGKSAVGSRNNPPESEVISSTGWTINPDVKAPPTNKKRKGVSMTTSTTTAAAGRTEWKSWLEKMGERVEAVPELPWPFRGSGSMWVDEDREEQQVKGFAVVEEEDKELVSKPLTVFEEIFDFNK